MSKYKYVETKNQCPKCKDYNMKISKEETSQKRKIKVSYCENCKEETQARIDED